MFMSLWGLVIGNGGQYYASEKLSFCWPNRVLIPLDLFAYTMLLEERKPGLDGKTIINDIVILIYVFKNDLPDQ